MKVISDIILNGDQIIQIKILAVRLVMLNQEIIGEAKVVYFVEPKTLLTQLQFQMPI